MDLVVTTKDKGCGQDLISRVFNNCFLMADDQASLQGFVLGFNSGHHCWVDLEKIYDDHKKCTAP